MNSDFRIMPCVSWKKGWEVYLYLSDLFGMVWSMVVNNPFSIRFVGKLKWAVCGVSYPEVTAVWRGQDIIFLGQNFFEVSLVV